jgi:hypothetical protein
MTKQELVNQLTRFNNVDVVIECDEDGFPHDIESIEESDDPVDGSKIIILNVRTV